MDHFTKHPLAPQPRPHRIRDGGTERTAFSPTGKDDFHVPEKFAKLWGR